MPNRGKRAKPKPAAKAKALPAPRATVRPRKATDKEALFAKHYAVSKNGRHAAIAAGYAEASAHVTASGLIRKPKVQDLINAALDEALGKAQANVDWVVRRWLALGLADARELVANYRDSCRYCHGKEHRYQYTAGEYLQKQTDYGVQLEAFQEGHRKREPLEIDVAGGLGFDPRREPHPDCPECFGRGVMFQFVADTRHLSASAAALYAGIKVTERGIEVKTRDPDAATTNLAKHLGMLAERHLHGGLPPDFDYTKATKEQLEAIAAGKKPAC